METTSAYQNKTKRQLNVLAMSSITMLSLVSFIPVYLLINDVCVYYDPPCVQTDHQQDRSL